MKKPLINLNLINTCSKKKDTDPVDLLIAAEQTIGQYPEDEIHVYTDGSAFKGTVNAGYGAHIYNTQTGHVRNYLMHVELNALILKQKRKR